MKLNKTTWRTTTTIVILAKIQRGISEIQISKISSVVSVREKKKLIKKIVENVF